MRAITPLLLLMTATLGSAAASSDASHPLSLHGWKQLASLPDPVGFGGMFAGVLNGRLVTGGGSQFRDKPIWLKGEKTFSDRVFTLGNLQGAWTEHSFRLPFKVAHYASAATADAIYLAGGIDAVGCVAEAWEITTRDDTFACTRLPDLPQTNGYAAAAIVGGRLYVAGGQPKASVRLASAEIWSLDLKEKSAWRREPDLPDVGVFLAAAAAEGEHLYVIGGVNLDAEGKAIQSAKTFRLHTATGKWERLPDLPEPRVGAATPCAVADGKILLIGGYARSFPGVPREHPGFSQQTFVYDIAQQRWENGPVLPKAEAGDRDKPGDAGPFPMIAAPGVVWLNHAVVISGEVRASTRSPAVVAWPLNQPGTR
jgi:N-acetylneuraminate epimerase